MNIILMTVLLTLLGAGLVVLLVWLSVVSWKSIKNIKKVEVQFDNVNKKIDDTNQALSSTSINLYTHIDEVSNDHWRNLEDYKKQISTEFEELDRGTLMDFIRRFDDLESNINKLRNTIKKD